MKIRRLATLIISGALCSSSFANECTETCGQEYQECKDVAESSAAKQACEDDMKQCTADCGET